MIFYSVVCVYCLFAVKSPSMCTGRRRKRKQCLTLGNYMKDGRRSWKRAKFVRRSHRQWQFSCFSLFFSPLPQKFPTVNIFTSMHQNNVSRFINILALCLYIFFLIYACMIRIDIVHNAVVILHFVTLLKLKD